MPHPTPTASSNTGVKSGTTPPIKPLKKAPAAIALAAYFSKLSI
jgi:hypothetical protein